MNRQVTVLVSSLGLLVASCSTDNGSIARLIGLAGEGIKHHCPQPSDTDTPTPRTMQFESVAFACNGTMATIIQPGNGDLYPTGHQVLGGVPFDIPATGPNFWFAQIAATSTTSPCSLVVAVNKPGVTEVHSLINTYWGSADGDDYAQIEFYGSDGAYLKVPLHANDDIRDFDYLDTPYANDINDITTVNVFDNHIGQLLDKQVFVLPAAFKTQTLSRIVLSDRGAYEKQRVFCSGITVGY